MSWFKRKLHDDDRALIQHVLVALGTMQSTLILELVGLRGFELCDGLFQGIDGVGNGLDLGAYGHDFVLLQIADLTAKVAAGQTLTDEEKTTLSDSVASLQSIAAGVVAALPAATQATQAATSGG